MGFDPHRKFRIHEALIVISELIISPLVYIKISMFDISFWASIVQCQWERLWSEN